MIMITARFAHDGSYYRSLRSRRSALTVFSPAGELHQVDYAREAVKRGACALAVVGRSAVVLAVERKAALELQDARTVRKIHKIDSHIYAAFAGLTADGRVLIDDAQVEAQSHRLSIEDPITVSNITRFVAQKQQVSLSSSLPRYSS